MKKQQEERRTFIMLKVGVIGCGNCGNQVAVSVTKVMEDVPVLAINSSSKDLATLPKSIPQRLIGDGKGSGKNRDESKEFLSKEIMKLLSDEEFKKFLLDLDVLFIISSTGGGTGSGISLLLTGIIGKAVPSVYTIPVGIMPSIKKEGESTHANSLEYLKELYEVLGTSATYMLYDNDKFAKEGTVAMMEKINETIAKDINILRCNYNLSTKYASIDERDMLNIIRTPGRLFVASLYDIKEKDLDDETIEDKLINEIKTNGHVELQRDLIVNRSGIIVTLSSTVLSQFNTHVEKVQGFVGSPVEEFEHIYVNDDRKLPNNVFLILSGLSKVNDRIRKTNDRIMEIEDARKQQEDDSELDIDLIGVVKESKTYHNTDINSNANIDIAGIFSDFGVDIK